MIIGMDSILIILLDRIYQSSLRFAPARRIIRIYLFSSISGKINE